MFEDGPIIKTVTLEKFKFEVRYTLQKGMPDSYLEDFIVANIEGYVYSQDAGKKVEFKYPSNWKESFKERWFPKWLLSKYPVVYTVKTFEVKATYPDLNIQGNAPVLRLISASIDKIGKP